MRWKLKILIEFCLKGIQWLSYVMVMTIPCPGHQKWMTVLCPGHKIIFLVHFHNLVQDTQKLVSNLDFFCLFYSLFQEEQPKFIQHIQRPDWCPGYRIVTTNRCIGHREVATVRCLGHQIVNFEFVLLSKKFIGNIPNGPRKSLMGPREDVWWKNQIKNLHGSINLTLSVLSPHWIPNQQTERPPPDILNSNTLPSVPSIPSSLL